MRRDLLSGLVGALVVVALVAADPLILRSNGVQFPDGTLQTTAAATDPRRSFYLTDATFDGAGALGACTGGYHMAAFYELLDPSNLRYAAEHPDALLQDDAGTGPPSGGFGWIRTGYRTETAGSVGQANCGAWTSAAVNDDGTFAALRSNWSLLIGDVTVPSPAWDTGPASCVDEIFVWCVQN